jgi:DNA-binding GntR family transcriptional regulator
LTVWDLKFHTFLVERSDHSLLAEIWKKTMYRFEMLVYKRIEGDAGVSGTVLIDHREIIVALKQRDLVKISSLHREINQRVCKETLSMLINRLPIR